VDHPRHRIAQAPGCLDQFELRLDAPSHAVSISVFADRASVLQPGHPSQWKAAKEKYAMKGKIANLVVLLLLTASALSGCTSPSSAAMPTPAGQSSRPSDPVGARDAVLTYLAENYGVEAPAAGLAWTEKHTKPEELVGGESYEYTAGDWLIAVSYPVVAPENIVYTIAVTNPTTSFRWEGQVDAQGHVTRTSAGTEPAGDGWRIYRNETLGYSFQYPAEAEIITADDPLQSLTVSGSGMGNATWVISHPTNRQEYRPPEGVDLAQWLTDHHLVGEKRLADVWVAGTTAVHFRHERSPQSYADDRYYFARGGQLYLVLIGHSDVEDWELHNRFLQSFQFEQVNSIWYQGGKTNPTSNEAIWSSDSS
jgi:hypothetical protein